jgi:hypothetical protein
MAAERDRNGIGELDFGSFKMETISKEMKRILQRDEFVCETSQFNNTVCET